MGLGVQCFLGNHFCLAGAGREWDEDLEGAKEVGERRIGRGL